MLKNNEKVMDKIVDLCGTRDPHRIAKDLGIEVLYYPFNRQRGAYKVIMRNRFMFIKNDLPDDVIVYLIMHEETNDYGDTKLKTIGKLLDQKVCVEGLVTICLRAMKEGTKKYFFRTQSDGQDISKSPEDMFPLEIDNDLKAVTDRIREFWGL